MLLSLLFEQLSNKFDFIYDDIVSRYAENQELDQTVAPSKKWVLGLLNQRPTSSLKTPEQKFVMNLLIKHNVAVVQGGTIKPSPTIGNKFRQYLASTIDRPSDTLKGALGSANQFKELRKLGMEAVGEEVKIWFSNLSDHDKELVEIAKELSASEIKFLKGLNERRLSKREYLSFVDSTIQRNPELLDKLIHLKLLSSNYTLNHTLFSELLKFINTVDFAIAKQVFPDIAQISIKLSADKAKLYNEIVLRMHPDSNDASGRVAWNKLNSMDQSEFDKLKSVAKSVAANKDASTENRILAIAVILFPNANSPGELVSLLDAEFKSRIDFKSLERRQRRVVGRRTGFKSFLNQ